MGLSLQNEHKFAQKAKPNNGTTSVGFKNDILALVLLPLIEKNPLQVKHCGPFVVDKRLNDVDCVISTPDHRQWYMSICLYIVSRAEVLEKPATVNMALTFENTIIDKQAALIDVQIVRLSHLEQQDQLRRLLLSFSKVISD